jgi:Mrp family chromosome partitioning ATPase
VGALPPRKSLQAARVNLVAPAPTTKRPLSSYIARARAFESIAKADQSEDLRPGTVDASFRWPAICRALSTRCPAALDSVADRLLARADEGQRFAGLLSLYRGQGVTSVMLALAARLAIRKRRILLVDGNFANPQLAAQLDVVPTAGWQETLLSNTPLADSLIRAADDRLDLLALGRDAMKFSAPPSSIALANVDFEQIGQGYDLVVVDLGAFFDSGSKLHGIELVRSMAMDAVVAVTGPDLANPRDLAALDEALCECRCKFLGTIENRAVGRRAAFHD